MAINSVEVDDLAMKKASPVLWSRLRLQLDRAFSKP